MLQLIKPAINVTNSRKNTTLKVFFLPFTRPASPSDIYTTLLLLLMLLTTTANRKTLFASIYIYSHGIVALLGSRLPTHVHKVQSCKVKILICAYNALQIS